MDLSPIVMFDEGTQEYTVVRRYVMKRFGVGSKVTRHNSAFLPTIAGGHGAWEAKSIDDAKTMAEEMVRKLREAEL